MAKGKSVHVVKHNGGWAALKKGSKRASFIGQTQSETIDQARKIARREHAELVIHGRDGRIRMKDSYGSDPHPPRG